jgi:hypothetical protein
MLCDFTESRSALNTSLAASALSSSSSCRSAITFLDRPSNVLAIITSLARLLLASAAMPCLLNPEPRRFSAARKTSFSIFSLASHFSLI